MIFLAILKSVRATLGLLIIRSLHNFIFFDILEMPLRGNFLLKICQVAEIRLLPDPVVKFRLFIMGWSYAPVEILLRG